ncbi:MAG: hypothetical protein AAGH78_08375 [Cyanobacteria bacterium P01_H01_bin.58]
MSVFPAFNLEALHQWLPQRLHQQYVGHVMQRVGMTRRRAECFVRLWLYLFLKDCQIRQTTPQAPLTELTFPSGWIECSCREAANVFYGDRDRGSDRSAGMMLDKLVALGLIRKQFDGNCTQIEIQSLPDLLEQRASEATVLVTPDAFDRRSDAIPIANLLASNYNWLNRNTDAVPFRIANILRDWAGQYATGMRVLRRCDNQNPVGFYLFYPVQRDSEIKFFAPPSQGLHLSQVATTDPFAMASPGDATCRAVFVRSWMIESPYRQQAQVALLQDAQQTLAAMQQDFPNLWDMYGLVIHPIYAELARVLGFQKTNADPKLSLYWVYQAVDRFLALDVAQAMTQLNSP